jgi:hypothetical protein
MHYDAKLAENGGLLAISAHVVEAFCQKYRDRHVVDLLTKPLAGRACRTKERRNQEKTTSTSRRG